ncbi:hypothetical protein HY993_04850 [Candidatus Micrarchaeota archaeon]|nr:hypothetical protein [Candidatus Micrarchaeota archaeon]
MDSDDYNSKPLSAVFAELGQSNRSYRFSSLGGRTIICVDGLMHSLKKSVF